MEHDEFLQAIRSPFHFATCDAVLRGCKIIDISKPLQWRRLSKKVRSPLGPLCEGAPPAGGGGENFAAARNISGEGKALSLRPCGATSLAEGGKEQTVTISLQIAHKSNKLSPKTMHSVENSYNLHYFRHNVKISQKNFIKMPKNTCNTGRRVL